MIQVVLLLYYCSVLLVNLPGHLWAKYCSTVGGYSLTFNIFGQSLVKQLLLGVGVLSDFNVAFIRLMSCYYPLQDYLLKSIINRV